MEVGRFRRSSVSGRAESTSFSSPIMLDKAKLAITTPRNIDEKPHTQPQHQHQHQHPQPQPQTQQQQLKNRTMKMFSKVQVVYYLTRNGQLEHPHFMEVSHLATQPLRLKDVIDRLTLLRGKAMPCQYSWSCKRSYKNGYVWNDLTENDVVYACEGSEYVLKGSEIIHHHSDFSEVGRLEELQIRKQKIGGHTKTNGLVTNKSNGTPQGHSYRHVSTVRHSKQDDPVKSYEHTENHNDDDDEDEEKGSCNSSNAPYSAMQMEQEESFSLPSTSSTNSDKQPPPPPPPPVSVESKRYEKEDSRVIQEEGDTTISTSLTRNGTTFLHMIACGGAGIVGPNKSKGKDKGSNNGSSSNRSLNLKMKNSFMPCLKQQLSSRGVVTTTTTDMIPPRISKEQRHDDVDDHHQAASNEDEDMMMVRYMSENPRFGNLQSEEKEYFSGTIIEAMTATNNQYHDHSQASAFTQPLVLTKSSSYNEHTRSSKGGLHVEAAASKVDHEDDDEKNENVKVKGMIKLCIPRKKSLSSSSTSATSKHTCY